MKVEVLKYSEEDTIDYILYTIRELRSKSYKIIVTYYLPK